MSLELTRLFARLARGHAGTGTTEALPEPLMAAWLSNASGRVEGGAQPSEHERAGGGNPETLRSRPSLLRTLSMSTST
ncbi:hypothetical protein CCHR01_11913 [Colletotrichum chrysophilum]|uniref:Uncharacterized protein n=1 Tax=Colletotrichum chrysophilum TaxID=1836956 RepID=A0AAD9ADP0_9PEZI|nr:hypothetical protein CCHR01_11913 [Colletotrichum chrysophilum]